jgi:hypothetical protein
MNANPEIEVETDATVRATSPMPWPATKKSLAVFVRRDAHRLIATTTAKYASPTKTMAGCAKCGSVPCTTVLL